MLGQIVFYSLYYNKFNVDILLPALAQWFFIILINCVNIILFLI